MPPYPWVPAHHKDAAYDSSVTNENAGESEDAPQVHACASERGELYGLHRQLTTPAASGGNQNAATETDEKFQAYLKEYSVEGKWYPAHRGVCFEDLSTYGTADATQSAKTLGTALWRTLTFRDVYEWVAPNSLLTNEKNQRAIISNFTGVVNSGEMML